MKCYTTLIFVSIVASVAALYAAESEFVAKDTLSGFRLETSHKALIISSEEDMALLHNNPITYQKGETVTVTAPDGEVTVLVDSPETSGVYAFKPTSGGLWKFSTSEDELVLLGVKWYVFGEKRVYSSESSGAYCLHTEGVGPDRKIKKREVPPVAYSSDLWKGNSSQAVRLTFTPPEGSLLPETIIDLEGQGAQSFAFPVVGVWSVKLELADGTIKMSCVIIESPGFVIKFR